VRADFLRPAFACNTTQGGELCKAVVGVQGPELVAAITALSDPASGSGGGV
jgi:hypothetical protein